MSGWTASGLSVGATPEAREGSPCSVVLREVRLLSGLQPLGPQGEGSGCHLSFLAKAAEKHVLCVKPARLPPLSPAEVWPGGS